MQFLGPAENGENANGCLFTVFSGRNRSGSNLFGSGHCSGSLCNRSKCISIFVPAGINFPPSVIVNQLNKSCSCILPIKMFSSKRRAIIGTEGYRRCDSLINRSKKLNSFNFSIDCAFPSPKNSKLKVIRLNNNY